MDENSIEGIDWFQMANPLIFYLTDEEDGAILIDNEDDRYLIMEQGPDE